LPGAPLNDLIDALSFGELVTLLERSAGQLLPPATCGRLAYLVQMRNRSAHGWTPTLAGYRGVARNAPEALRSLYPLLEPA
jgi:hypothetical protein